MLPGQTRLLFKSAAIFNILAGLPFLLAPGPMSAMMGFELNPVASMFAQIVFSIIVAFGCAYWMIALDPVRYRPFILLGLVLKIVVIAVIYGHWLAGNIPWQLPAIAIGDIIFSVLFGIYYKRTTY